MMKDWTTGGYCRFYGIEGVRGVRETVVVAVRRVDSGGAFGGRGDVRGSGKRRYTCGWFGRP